MKKKKQISVILTGTFVTSMFAVPTFAADRQTAVSQIPVREMSFETNSEHLGAEIDRTFDNN